MKLLRALAISAGAFGLIALASFLIHANTTNDAVYDVTDVITTVGALLAVISFGAIFVLNIMGFFRKKP